MIKTIIQIQIIQMDQVQILVLVAYMNHIHTQLTTIIMEHLQAQVKIHLMDLDKLKVIKKMQTLLLKNQTYKAIIFK